MTQERRDVADELGRALNALVLPGVRRELCAPVIDAAPEGIDEQTWPLLHLLGRQGQSSAARLADQIGIDRSGASRHAQRLESMGLLQRSVDPFDQRAARLSLTEEGAQLARELDGVLADHLHELLRDWPRGLAESVVAGLDHLIAAAG